MLVRPSFVHLGGRARRRFKDIDLVIITNAVEIDEDKPVSVDKHQGQEVEIDDL